jgi:serine/threonine protein kinase/Flp pilus assembly protein TadD
VTNEGPGDVADVTQREFAGGQKVFGRYTLIKILGRGGMGVVWLARDEELERDVALKFLPDLIIHDRALLNDLKRETRRSLELTHKNIVRIHDFVNDERSGCISMEYIDGETLSNLRAEKEQKVFEPSAIAAWTGQLCDALDYAHNHAKIIHRDLKPANLMVNKKGDLKVSDFGIARSLSDTVSRLTMEQGRSGTLVYMSPQQLDGERGTHLDDIYSLGATLYDLLTSKPPFYSGNIDRQVQERVPPSMSERRKDLNIEPASVPLAWEQTVAACLAKNPTERPQSTVEVAQRLQLSAPAARTARAVSAKPLKKITVWAGLVSFCLVAIAGWYFAIARPRTKTVASSSNLSPLQAAALPEKSIAVLPFENLSTEKDDEFFADGIQDDVLASLGKIKDLKVIARASVMVYRGAAVAGKLREIGQSLQVSHVLQGSVRRSATRVVINVALIDTRNDSQVWSQRYDRTINDSLSLQGELAIEIARELRATLSPTEQNAANKKPTENAEAYVLYLRGRENENRFFAKQPEFDAAENFYQQAVNLDPKFALAHARLSMMVSRNHREEGKIKAREEADSALRLQPDLGEGRLALAYYFQRCESDFDQAMHELGQASALLPNSSEVARAMGKIYRSQRKWREALDNFERAARLDPDNTQLLHYDVALTYRAVRNWPAALRARTRLKAALEKQNMPTVADTGAAIDEFYATSSLAPFRNLLTLMPTDKEVDPNEFNLVRYDVAMMERNYPVAEEALEKVPAEFLIRIDFPPKSLMQALIQFVRRDPPGRIGATLAADSKKAQDDLAKSADAFENHLRLGVLFSFVGKKDDAIREGLRGVDLANPREKDYALANLALIYALTGKPDEAVRLIEPLLTRPGPIDGGAFESMTVADLRLRPQWDSLRSNPRFKKILAGPEPQTIY